jgi:hypothetical protein
MKEARRALRRPNTRLSSKRVPYQYYHITTVGLRRHQPKVDVIKGHGHRADWVSIKGVQRTLGKR